MPPPLMPPSIQKPQKLSPNSCAGTIDEGVGVKVGGPGNDGLQGAFKVLLERAAERTHVAPLKLAGDPVEDFDCLTAAEPLGFTAQQVFFSDHFEDGTDILCHAAMNQHQALLKLLASFARNFGFGEDVVIGKKASAADAELRIAFCAQELRG